MIQTFRPRTSTVQAIQFDGHNLTEVEVAVKEVTSTDPAFGTGLEVGSWVLLFPTSYQVLPKRWFDRTYELVADAPGWHHVVQPRTCFSCSHYRESWCLQHEERIDSETYAAKDCDTFDPETF